MLLVHPGGPFWRNKDIGSWSIPKGEYEFSQISQKPSLAGNFAKNSGSN